MISAKSKTITMVPFDKSEAHYEAAVGLHNIVWSEVPDTVTDWKRRDKNRQQGHYFQRYLIQANETDAYVGTALAMHTSWTFHPQRFLIEVLVHPDHQGNGYGREAYAFLLDSLADQDPMELEGGTRRDRARGVRFLEDRGYELKTVEYSSRLELEEFDPTAYGDYESRLVEQGLEIINMTEFMARYEDYHRRIYDVIYEIDKDVPWHNDPTPQPFDLFVRRFDSQTDRIDECYLFAMDGDRPVGVTMLFRSPAKEDTLYTGLTGVVRSHRRQGIAMALKLRSLGYAKHNLRTSDGSIPGVVTENEENNPMYNINVRLGFEREPDWVSYVKTIRPIQEADAEDS